jgi:hypothetical protein
VVKEWICQEEPLIREDGTSVGVGFRQMVELVRCKDCVNKECFGRDGKIVCDLDGFLHEPDWFCADGERKESR